MEKTTLYFERSN